MADRVQFEIVTPSRIVLSVATDMVVMPGGDGDLGVLPGHAPLLTTLRPGLVDLYEGERVKSRVFVEGGFAEVTSERCVILAQEALALDEVTPEQAKQRCELARQRLEAAQSSEDRRLAGAELAASETMCSMVESTSRERR